MKLDSASRNLDSKIDTIKNNSQTRNNSRGKVQSLVGQTVPFTLGGDLAAPRYPRLASNTPDTGYNSLSGRAPLLDINGSQQRGQRNRGSSAFGNQTVSSAGDGRMLRLMWLLLLISLGANFYLAMLSRSFYTQYEELADELRETFSTSSSTSTSRSRSMPSSRSRSTHSSRDRDRDRDRSTHTTRERDRDRDRSTHTSRQDSSRKSRPDTTPSSI